MKSAVAELSPAKDAFYITFTIDEGKQFKFGTVNVVSALKGIDTKEMEPQISTKTSDTYNAAKIENSIDALTKELGNRGFAFVEVDPKLDRKPEQQIINLSYNIKGGAACLR